jgi:prepilin-type N-terminal cleavage/methylation domain-containing protein
MTSKNEKGLTLIELLITIAVIAIVAAISIPVITNVIESARTSSAGSMEAQVNAFIEQYAASGKVTFNGTDTFTGWVDLNANGLAEANEAIETFTVDTTQFGLSNVPMTSTSPVGESYANVTAFPSATATVTVGGGTGGTQQATGAGLSVSFYTGGPYITPAGEASPVAAMVLTDEGALDAISSTTSFASVTISTTNGTFSGVGARFDSSTDTIYFDFGTLPQAAWDSYISSLTID